MGKEKLEKRKKIKSSIKIGLAIGFLILVIAYNSLSAEYWTLSKNITQIGEVVKIEGDCASGSIFSMETNIGLIQNTDIKINNVGETKIREITTNCENTGSINLISTEDGKPYFMSIDDFNMFTLWELLFVGAILFISWFILFIKK